MHLHSKFAHLHVHTQYSLLDGACKIKELVKRAAELKFPALAITDHGNMFGVIEFYLEAQKQGVKPIIGTECYIAPRSRFDKSADKNKITSFHVVLLAKNLQGYQNIMKLSSIGFLEGFYYKPRIDKSVLKEYSEGVICLSACLHGEVAYYAAHDQQEEAERALEEYIEIFGKDDFYLEVQDHEIPEQKKVIQVFKEFSKKYNVKLVATNDIHYLDRKEAEAHEALLCIQTGTTLDDPKRMRFSTSEFYLKSEQEMREIFSDIPEAIDNTLEIVEKCNVELKLGENLLPYFEVPEDKKHEEYLRELCMEGLNRHLNGEIPDNYIERLDYELSVINSMGYTDYFLITWDFMKYSRDNDIAVGPGRGSAAGSLVSYALRITEVDPIPFNLIFERFLNPERVSMPDIDIDFCQKRRDEVIKYVGVKYGNENVSQIITFNTLAAKGVIRDVGRVMAMPLPEVDKIAKLIPDELGISIEKALTMEPKLREMYDKNSQVARLIDTAKALEGLNRHAGIHAAGVVISDKPLSEYVPLFKAKDKDAVTTQYKMKDLEKTGLLKMDFLGLKTLTFINETLKIIKRTENVDIDIAKISFEDKKTYELLCKGETFGVFQFESSGMRDLLRKSKPNVFEDVAALLALYRPGPLGSGMVDDFINRKNNGAKIEYDHPLLEPILKETYGVILYQEQVMKIVSALAGFSLAQADLLRRAIGKKIPEVLAEQKKHFVEGASKNGVDEKVAEKIFNLIEYFAGYGFNKSHSVAYSFISYQTAFLKANYPIEFMTALLTIEKDNTDKVVRYIDEAKRLGFKILPPCVNESQSEFVCDKKKGIIRFGLSAVKNVGVAAIENVIFTRNEHGAFKSIYDFTESVDSRQVNKKVLESLIKGGAFDCFKRFRSQHMACMEHAIEVGSTLQKDKDRGQLSFFKDFEAEGDFEEDLQQIPDIEEWSEGQLLANEKEVLGFYISSHPLAKYETVLKTYARTSSIGLPAFPDQAEVSIGGIIDAIIRKTTRKGDPMAFVKIQDLQGKCEVIFFPDMYKKSEAFLSTDQLVFIKGKNNSLGDDAKIIAQEIIPLDEVRKRLTKVFSIDLFAAGLDQETLHKLKIILQKHKGEIPVYLNFKEPDGKWTQVITGEDFNVYAGDALFREVEDLVGENAIKIIT